jgi:hypothetical protein
MRWDTGVRSALIPTGDNEFLDRAFGGRITFPNSQGAAKQFTYNLLGSHTTTRTGP